jgi:GTP cyclohydrolase II
MTNNPDKMKALEEHGIEVIERVPHAFPPNDHNVGYLRTKALRSGHFLHAGTIGLEAGQVTGALLD